MLRKQGRSISTWLLAGSMLTATLVPTTAQADTSNQQLNQDQQDATKMQNQLQQLNQQKQNTQNQIDQLENQISDDMQQSSDLQQNIAETDKELAAERVKLRSRVKVMYEDGDVSFWNVLLGSTDFSDFMDRLSALTLIVQQDDHLITDYRNSESKLQQEQTALQAKQQARKAQQQQLLALEQNLNAQSLQVNSNLNAKQQQIDAEEAALASLSAVDSSPAAPAASGSSSSSDSSAQSTAQGATSSAASNTAQSAANVSVSNGTYIWPVPSSHTITSGYGPRDGGFHAGIDIGCPLGTPIVAVADGVVRYAGPAEGFGHWVVIQHANGLMSVYGHMYANGVLVSPGQVVKQGQVIAMSGSDGESSGPHLHFSFATGVTGSRMDYVDPTAYLQ